jgi:hypothetical protein
MLSKTILNGYSAEDVIEEDASTTPTRLVKDSLADVVQSEGLLAPIPEFCSRFH